MNIAFLLKPKNSLAFLYSDFTLRQSLEKMRRSGYTALPVISRDGKYIGTVSHGDFLWFITDCCASEETVSMKMLEETPLTKIIRKESYSPVKITADVDEMLSVALNQNFVPVTDDLGSFIGIVTRRDIIRRFIAKES